MQRRYMAVLSLAALLLPGAVLAAGKPKEEKTKGDVVSVGADRLSLKTKRGSVTVLLTQKSRIVMGGAEMPSAALKQGVRVTVVGTIQPTGEIVAREVQLPAPAAPMQSTMPSGHSGHAH
ncbi:MAG: hypothetical protein J0H49_12930 [Acidobacteria bacterium]|jgi:hypothetical protein|nr:hypothetical protein [Acidobacteriota bacterium]